MSLPQSHFVSPTSYISSGLPAASILELILLQEKEFGILELIVQTERAVFSSLTYSWIQVLSNTGSLESRLAHVPLGSGGKYMVENSNEAMVQAVALVL